MTEEAWLASIHGQPMLVFVQKETMPIRTRWQGPMPARRFPISERKVRLIEVACCERITALVPMAHLRGLVSLARQQAEGKADVGDPLRALERAALRISEQLVHTESVFRGWSPAELLAVAAIGRLFSRAIDPGGDVLGLAARALAEADAARHPGQVHERRLYQALVAEQAHQADLVRDVIGNPFQPVHVEPAWRTANDGAVVRIAESIVAEDAFAELPILADALDDAGCTDEAILAHCRGPGPHVAGCWVVDLLLEKK